VQLELKVLLVHREQLAQLEHRVLKAKKVKLELKVYKAHRV
jgi:hypothetical protein